MASFGKLLIIAGAVLVIAGLLVLLSPKLHFLGRLPGDIIIRKKNFVLYFPLATSIVVSVILSLLFWIFRSK